MPQHNPEQPPPFDGVFDTIDGWDHYIGLLELTEEFFQQASPQVRAELALFLTTQRGWSPECGLHAYLDSLAFTAYGHRTRPSGTDCSPEITDLGIPVCTASPVEPTTQEPT